MCIGKAHFYAQSEIDVREFKQVMRGWAGRPFMLYDLEQDPDEQRNLVGTPAAAGLEGALRDLLLRRLLREQYALQNDHWPA